MRMENRTQIIDVSLVEKIISIMHILENNTFPKLKLLNTTNSHECY